MKKTVSKIMKAGVMAILMLMTILPSADAGEKKNTKSVPVKILQMYDISAEGYSVGNVKAVRTASDENGAVVVKEIWDTEISFSLDGLTYSLKSQETAEYDLNRLRSYTAVITENDSGGKVTANFFNKDIQVETYGKEGKIQKTGFFKKGDYDFTDAYMPLNRLKLKQGKYTKNMLCFQDGSIRIINLRVAQKASVTAAGKTFQCKVLDFDYGVAKGRVWLAEDSLGCFVVQEYSSTEDGPFKRVLTEYKTFGI